ncbi:uncharacterized protein LOC27207327 [Drosophila simulans]|uniref:MD-2-related lipid-recognition domain-containing protein n=1 Tax=Drosophila simulans TaxID=7240 RepID=A0A0J9RS61_DROSI|nr:uncharacterized protein LOC27207327 [Drosophila simulans]KMY98676.1 uncharacterized protein Dsimw501_GD27478 [Drosophila simulans]
MTRGVGFGILFTLLWPILINGRFHLKNVVCESLDTSYSDFKRCEMKVIGRGVTAFYMIWKFYSVPIDNFELNLSLHKRSIGYRPFLFNQSLDYCYYMRSPKAYPLIYMLHKSFLSTSNINHSCPYDHDLIIKDFIYKDNDLKDLPIPNGDYMIQIKVATDKKYRACIKVHMKRMD